MKTVNAVAGVLYKDGCVLIASRPKTKSFANCWEFPGGKIEVNETSKEALIRELKEEIGVATSKDNLKHIIFIRQPYETHQVNLDVMLVNSWQNEPVGLEGQKLHWQALDEFCSKSPLLITTQKILTLLNRR